MRLTPRFFSSHRLSRRVVGMLLVLAAMLLLHPAESAPAAGDLDTSFADHGTLNFAPDAKSTPFSVAPTGDGRFLFACRRQNQVDGPYECVIHSFSEDGSPDLSFGENGIALFTIPTELGTANLRKMIVLKNGKILVSASSSKDVFLVRFLASGQPDDTFGDQGLLRANITPEGPYYNLATHDLIEHTDGLVYFSGKVQKTSSSIKHLRIYRVSADGQISTLVDRSPFDYDDSDTVLASGLNHDLFLGASEENSSSVKPYILQFHGASGEKVDVIRHPFSTGMVKCLTVDPLGMLLVGVYRSKQLCITRFQIDRQVDSYFADGGTATLPVDDTYSGSIRMTLQKDEKILITRTAIKTMLWRLTRGGQLDPTFSEDGPLTVTPPFKGRVSHLSLPEDEKLLLGGYNVGWPTGARFSRLHAGPLAPISGPQTTGPPVLLTPEVVTQAKPYTLGITVTGEPPFTYQWRLNGKPIQSWSLTSNTATYTRYATIPLLINGEIGPDDVYTVAIGNKEGWTVSPPLTVYVKYPPAFDLIRPPAAIIPTQPANFSISFKGRHPIQYTLWKDGQPIDTGTTLASKGDRTINHDFAIQEPGIYEVSLTNVDGETRTESIPITAQKDPFISIAQDRLYHVGELSVPLTSNIATAAWPSRRVDWKKDGRLLQRDSQTLTELPYRMTLANAGRYTATLHIPGKSHTSEAVEIGVVDPAPQTVFTSAGRKVILSAQVAGNGLTYQWNKEGEPLSQSPTLPIVDAKTLLISKADINRDPGLYTCTVTHRNGQSLDSGAITLIADPAAPRLPEGLTQLPPATLGQAYRFDLETDFRATRFHISGLPAGLTYDRTTGLIQGQPRRAGDYRVKVAASNLAGSSRFALSLTVQPLAHQIQGGYAGFEKGIEQGLIVQLTLTRSASFSARVLYNDFWGDRRIRAFTGKLTWNPSTHRYEFTPREAENRSERHFSLALALDPLATAPAYPLTGTLFIGRYGSVEFNATRQASWAPHSEEASAYSGYYTAGFGGILESVGYAAITVSTRGRVTFVGRLPDGASVVHSSSLDTQGRFPVSAWLYGQRGRFKAWGTITPDPASDYRNSTVLSNDGAWRRPGSSDDAVDTGSSFFNDFHRTGGFSGSKYLPPNLTGISSPLMFNLTEDTPNNICVNISGYGHYATDYGQLTAKHKLVTPPRREPSTSDQAQITSLAFNPSNGLFTATALIHDFDIDREIYQGTRRAKFRGIALRSYQNLNPIAIGFSTWKDRFQHTYYVGNSFWATKSYSVLRSSRIQIEANLQDSEATVAPAPSNSTQTQGY